MSSTPTTTPEDDAFFQPKHVPESFKKAVGVVQVAMGELGLLHRKCYNVALANAYEGLGQGKRTFRVQVSVVVDWCNFNSHNYQALYDVFADLRNTPVKSITFDKKEAAKGRRRRRVSGDGLISSFAVIEGGILEYSFSDHMAEILHEPEQYIWLSLNAQNKFDSKYELNLFENCVRYIQVGTTGFKPIEDWRALLGANEEYYDDFKNLNRKVIKRATKGVNDKSGILLTPELRREKRKVSALKFDIRENPQMQLFEHDRHKRLRETEAYQMVKELGLTDVEAIYWIEKKGVRSVLEVATYVAGKKADNPAGYLVTALRGNFGEKSEEERQKAADSQKQLEHFKAEQAAQENARLANDELQARFKAHQRTRAAEILAALSGPDLASVREEISQDIAVPSLAKRWNEIDRDIDLIDTLPRLMRRDMTLRLHNALFGRWGNDADRDIKAFEKIRS